MQNWRTRISKRHLITHKYSSSLLRATLRRDAKEGRGKVHAARQSSNQRDGSVCALNTITRCFAKRVGNDSLSHHLDFRVTQSDGRRDRNLLHHYINSVDCIPQATCDVVIVLHEPSLDTCVPNTTQHTQKQRQKQTPAKTTDTPCNFEGQLDLRTYITVERLPHGTFSSSSVTATPNCLVR